MNLNIVILASEIISTYDINADIRKETQRFLQDNDNATKLFATIIDQSLTTPWIHVIERRTRYEYRKAPEDAVHHIMAYERTARPIYIEDRAIKIIANNHVEIVKAISIKHLMIFTSLWQDAGKTDHILYQRKINISLHMRDISGFTEKMQEMRKAPDAAMLGQPPSITTPAPVQEKVDKPRKPRKKKDPPSPTPRVAEILEARKAIKEAEKRLKEARKKYRMLITAHLR